MLGLDTGFFVQLLRGHAEAVATWRRLAGGEEEAICSCLSLFELERLGMRGALEPKAVAVLTEAIDTLCPPQWVDTPALMSQAVGLSQGIGLPAMDALILAGLLRGGAHTIYTTDSDFERYRKSGITVRNLGAA